MQRNCLKISSLLCCFFLASAPTNAANGDGAEGSSTNSASLVGHFLYEGTPPKPRLLHEHGVTDESLLVGEDHGIANVFVWIRSREVPLPPPDTRPDPVKIRFVDNRFEPHVLAYWSIAKCSFVNESSQSMQLNFPAAALNKVFSGGQTAELTVRNPSKLPERLNGNLQLWCSAYVFPAAHPYVAVSGHDGRFEIKDLPTGKWEFAIWQERSGFLSTDKLPFPKCRSFTLEIKPGKNDMGDQHVDPKVLASG